MHRQAFSKRPAKEYARGAMPVFCVFLLLTASAGFAQTVAGKKGAQDMPSCSDVPLQQSVTLGDVLKAACVPDEVIAPAQIPIEAAITSYAVLNSKQELIIAYYESSPDSELKPPIHVLQFIKPRHWQRNELLAGQLEPKQSVCLGAIVSIHRVGTFITVGTHMTPSAECTLVLDGELKIEDIRYGRMVAGFAPGKIVYEHNPIHFAPTHPLVLSLYDAESQTETPVYPPDSDLLRKAYIEQLRQLDPSDRCRGPGCAAFPEQFESTLMDIASDDRTHSFAFLAEFTPTGYVPTERVKGSEVRGKVIYVYQISGDSLDEREFPAEEMKSRFGTEQLNGLLEPNMLRRIFDR